jgi:hypothetical protein
VKKADVIAKATDTEYEETTVAKVRHYDGGGWEITRADGWALYSPNDAIEPHIGDTLRIYGRGIGFPFRGIDLNGVTVFYKTEAQRAVEAARSAAKSDKQRQREYTAKAKEYAQREYTAKPKEYAQRIAKLPDVCQRRIARFRRTNPEFNWRFLSYELVALEDGVLMAEHCKTEEAIRAFHDLLWEQQKAQIPDLFDGHSGNSFGFACRIARFLVTEPRYVPLEHGAISMLVGCEEFGCQPGKGLEGEDLAFYQSLSEAANQQPREARTAGTERQGQ